MKLKLEESKLVNLTPFQRWIWLATHSATEESARTHYETNYEVVDKLRSRNLK